MRAPRVPRPAAFIALLSLVVIGCSGHRPNPAAVDLYQGTYTFTGQVASQLIDGYIAFDEGTFLMASDVGSCSGLLAPVLDQAPRARTRFGCNGLSVQFHVAGSELGEHARASMRVQEGTTTRRVCSAWGRDAAGNRVCQQYMTEVVPRYVVRHGVLTVAKVEVNGN
jgi:hypothetical protein